MVKKYLFLRTSTFFATSSVSASKSFRVILWEKYHLYHLCHVLHGLTTYNLISDYVKASKCRTAILNPALPRGRLRKRQIKSIDRHMTLEVSFIILITSYILASLSEMFVSLLVRLENKYRY